MLEIAGGIILAVVILCFLPQIAGILAALLLGVAAVAFAGLAIGLIFLDLHHNDGQIVFVIGGALLAGAVLVLVTKPLGKWLYGDLRKTEDIVWDEWTGKNRHKLTIDSKKD